METLQAENYKTMDEIYTGNIGLIRQCAFEFTSKFNCHNLFEDLVSVGIITLLEQYENFDLDKNTSFTTFIYPHIRGSMQRYIEMNLNSISLTKRNFEKFKDMKQNLIIFSIDSESAYNAVSNIASKELPVHNQIYLKICIEELEKNFNKSLSFKEKFILGSFYGVFGFEKLTLENIGEHFTINENAALKAKYKALKKLTDICLK